MKHLAIASAVLTLSIARPANATNKLFLAWDPATAACEGKVSRFFGCITGHSDFNALVQQYSGGRQLVVGGTAVLNGSCTPKDAQCVATLAGFSLSEGDVLVEFVIAQTLAPPKAFNSPAAITIAGRHVSIEFAWVEADTDCDKQTCTGSHEVFEAATDGVSAGCCGGQVPPDCPRCDATCAQRPNGSCYALTCEGEPFSVAYVGNPEAEFVPIGCTQFQTAQCSGALGATCARDSECCSGLACGTTRNGPQRCCASVDASCNGDADCCGAARCDAVTRACSCVRSQDICTTTADCCAGLACDTGKCVAVPPTNADAGDAATVASGGCATNGGDRARGGAAWFVLAVAAVRLRRRVRFKPRM